MTPNPIEAFRAELRQAAGRRACRYRRRRRLGVSLAIACGALLVAGGAIAAQRTWFDNQGATQIRIRYTEDRVSGLTEALETCLASHGARRVLVRDGGVVFRNASAAMSQCGAFATSIDLTCGPASSASASQDMKLCIVKGEWTPGLQDGTTP